MPVDRKILNPSNDARVLTLPEVAVYEAVGGVSKFIHCSKEWREKCQNDFKKKLSVINIACELLDS